MKLLSIAVVISAALINSATADVIYSSSSYSNIANPQTNAFCSTCGGSQQIGNVFSLSQDSHVDSVNFAIQANYPYDEAPHNIKISIFNVNNQQVFAQSYSPFEYATSYVGNQVNDVYAEFNELNLQAGSYKIWWYDYDDMGIPGYASNDGGQFASNDGGYTYWSVGNSESAFQLNGSSEVPVPAAAWLFGTGITGLAALKRKK